MSNSLYTGGAILFPEFFNTSMIDFRHDEQGRLKPNWGNTPKLEFTIDYYAISLDLYPLDMRDGLKPVEIRQIVGPAEYDAYARRLVDDMLAPEKSERPLEANETLNDVKQTLLTRLSNSPEFRERVIDPARDEFVRAFDEAALEMEALRGYVQAGKFNEGTYFGVDKEGYSIHGTITGMRSLLSEL